ncbi:hypothetical protein FHL15_007654 [Xylaria flabelliformis]|uniref:F-box domain-containing protein n=1 Tax=Xylaria flabelliformis TaxID=2512241 RepID=A0A553HU05_9PEZI|nr:hypothetical protein FHL15_007654 [Xylaria flabelliformis]
MGDSILFTVPLEIRQLIYEYYLSFEHSDTICHERQWEAFLKYSKPLSAPLPSLMVTCKRIYIELRSDVHSTAVVQFIGPERFWPGLHIHTTVHGILRFERLHHLVMQVNEESLRGPVWFFLEAVAGKMCVLEHLTIDWEFTLRAEEHNENHKRRFLQALHSITSLRTIRINGCPRRSWRQAIEQEMIGTNVVIRIFRNRWWLP